MDSSIRVKGSISCLPGAAMGQDGQNSGGSSAVRKFARCLDTLMGNALSPPSDSECGAAGKEQSRNDSGSGVRTGQQPNGCFGTGNFPGIDPRFYNMYAMLNNQADQHREQSPIKRNEQGDLIKGLKGEAQGCGGQERAGPGNGSAPAGNARQSPPAGSIAGTRRALDNGQTSRGVVHSQPPVKLTRDPNGNARATADRLQSLEGTDANQAIEQLQRRGQLDQLAANMVKPGVWCSEGGLRADEQQRFLRNMAGKLNGANLASVQRFFAAAGGDHAKKVADAVADHASSQTRADFVQGIAASASETPCASPSGAGPWTARYYSSDAQAAATVLSSLRLCPAGLRRIAG